MSFELCYWKAEKARQPGELHVVSFFRSPLSAVGQEERFSASCSRTLFPHRHRETLIFLAMLGFSDGELLSLIKGHQGSSYSLTVF